MQKLALLRQKFLRSEADVIKARLRRTAEDVIEIGLALKRVKETLPHGMFMPWLASEFDMNLRSAQRFMQVADRFSGKYDTVSYLDPKALYALAAPSTSDEIVAAVEERIAAGELVTAAALASYAKQANDDELMRMATRIRDRAIRRAGELLAQIEKKPGANQNIGAGDRPKVETRSEVARDAGMSPHQQKQALRVAAVPQADFERQVESPNPPTVTALAAQGTKPAVKPIIDLGGRTVAGF